MTTNKLPLLLLLSLNLSQSAAANAPIDEGSSSSLDGPLLTRDHFSKILFTSLDDHSTLQHLHVDHDHIKNDNERRLQGMPSQEITFTQDDDAWQKMVQHGWDWSKRRHRRQKTTRPTGSRRNLRSESSTAGSDDTLEKTAATNSPFVVCSDTSDQSGYQRLQVIVQSLDIPMKHTQPVYNTVEESCFIVTSTASAMESYQDQIVQASFDLDDIMSKTTPSVKFAPLFDALKLPRGTAMNILEDDNWAPPQINSVADLKSLKRMVTNEFSYDNTTVEMDLDIRKWSRSFLVDLLPGSIESGSTVDSVANEIVEYVKDMAMVPPNSAASNSYLRSNSVNLDGSNGTSTRITAETAVSTREAFSLTATDEEASQRTFHNAHNIWSTALSEGFEAPHGCQVMLDTLEVRTRLEQGAPASDNEEAGDEFIAMAGFEVILHPPSQFMKQAAVESSAWNKHCALSLLMGLAIHPSVQTVEVARPIELASMLMDEMSRDGEPSAHAYSNDAAGVIMSPSDVEDDSTTGEDSMPKDDIPNLESHNWRKKEGKTNPQWITQSGILDSRPFFDVGLDGTGQVISVADGGLDTDNCYFRDASSSNGMYGNDEDSWDFSNRKVVHYDDTFGDRTEMANGHGTYVASIAVGKKSVDGQSEVTGHADGSAPGAQLAFFDMEDGYFGIADPGVDRLLASLYSPNKGGTNKGSRVINGSWGRSYMGQYTSFCRQYDTALRNQYPDLLLVVSAGNTGRAGKSSIQDPADCKNPLAVGSSMSYGSDIRDKELGIEYLADYSSRGPTQDNRIKPDIVAPGHFVLAARANPNKVGDCDGDGEPNVKMNSPGGTGVKYTTGTSMAAPVLAGTAAILRQYFEEGFCTSQKCCGYKGCGVSMNPSGSLIKAVLMNGAQPLQGGVQYVPGGKILDDQPLRAYDMNQGFGRVNLLNSVPLQGKNDLQMLVVNDKVITQGSRQIYKVYIDSSSCNAPLSATLAWYDQPGAVGCTNCLVNDLDLSIKTSTGTEYPNGRSSRDTKNTVERIQTSPDHGQEVRIIVEANNFATAGQKYSLAVTGCFGQQPVPSSTPAITAAQQSKPSSNDVTAVFASSNTSSSSSSCSSSRRFQLELNTADDGPQLSWNLIKSLDDGGVGQISKGPSSSEYLNNRTYMSSACIDPGAKYRFQLRDQSGEGIRSGYKLTYGDQVIFNTQWSSSGNLGKTSSFRFKVNENGEYQKLGSNTFTPHVQLSESAEIGAEGLSSYSSVLKTESRHDGDSNASSEHMLSPNEDSGEDGREEKGELNEQGIYIEYEDGEGGEEVLLDLEEHEYDEYGSLEVGSLAYLLSNEDDVDSSNKSDAASPMEMTEELIYEDSVNELSEHTFTVETTEGEMHNDSAGEDDELIWDDEDDEGI